MIRLPDFDEVRKEVVKEVQERITRRTPRSNIDHPHLQDAWNNEQPNEVTDVIYNDTEYGPYVESGTSKMAGAHMVLTTLDEVPIIIDAAVERAFKGASK